VAASPLQVRLGGLVAVAMPAAIAVARAGPVVVGPRPAGAPVVVVHYTRAEGKRPEHYQGQNATKQGLKHEAKRAEAAGTVPGPAT